MEFCRHKVGLYSALVPAVLLLSITGCEEEQPYTPFEVATSLPGGSEAPTQELTPEKEAAAAARTASAQAAPKGAKTWNVFDRKLRAPSATVLLNAIPAPATQSDEVLVWIAPISSAGTSEAGLWLFGKDGQRVKQLLPFPAYLPQGEDCQYLPTLAVTGQASVTARLKAVCETRILPGTPTQTLTVVAPNQGSEPLIHLRLLDTNPGESMSFSVNSKDRDGDGNDDVELNVSLTAPSGTKETLPLRWLARTAGASRQPDAPRKEAAARSSRLSTASVRKAERGKAPDQIDALRRLLMALCSEFATQKVENAGGSPLKCGDLRTSLGRLTHSAVQAHLGEKSFNKALGELERAAWLGKKPSDKQLDALKKLVLSKVAHGEAQRLARFDVPTRVFDQAYASPLHFAEDGQLWAQTPDGKTKRLTMKGDPPLVTPATEEEPEKRIEPPTWGMLPEGPGEKILTAALPSCQRSEVQLALGRPGAAPSAPLPIAMLAPRPGNCRTYTGLKLSAVPIQWSGGQLQAVVGGQLITTGGHERSVPEPVAWGTSLGLALVRGRELSLWTGKETKKLSHCVTSEGAKKVACVKGDAVVVLSRVATP